MGPMDPPPGPQGPPGFFGVARLAPRKIQGAHGPPARFDFSGPPARFDL